MNKEEKTQEQFRTIAERLNPNLPYTKNRKSWNKAFIFGMVYATAWHEMYHGCKMPPFDEPVLVKSYTGRIEVATFVRNERGVGIFDKEKELSNFSVEYWRELYE